MTLCWLRGQLGCLVGVLSRAFRLMVFRPTPGRAGAVPQPAAATAMVLVLTAFKCVCAASGPLFPSAQYTVGDAPHSVAIQDLDGDGDADLAVANRHSDNVAVLLNQGDGTFAAQVTYAVGNGPVSVATDDL
ncbi:MAG: FG-GAP-like repeat-containing protein, partial [Planctomycetota bacterium]